MLTRALNSYMISLTEWLSKVGTTPSMPRVATRQQHRSNIVTLSLLDYYQKKVAIPFPDHTCTYLNEQFSALSATAPSLLSLVPIVMHKRSVDLSEVIKQYSNDLPSPELVERELLHWKSKCSALPNICRYPHQQQLKSAMLNYTLT